MSGPTDGGVTEGGRVSAGQHMLASMLASRPGKYVSRLAHRKQLWCGVARVVGGVLLIAIVLSTARQSSTPAPLHSEIVRDAGDGAGPERTIDWVKQYAWLSKEERKKYEMLTDRIPPPAGCSRVKVAAGSFADWLRHLPVLPEGTPVKTGKAQVVVKADDPRLATVVALQPRGGKLLDGINVLLRLRAEYFWAAERPGEVAFHFTNGYLAKWRDWADGARPTGKGREVEVRKTVVADESRSGFCCYLETVFRYTTVYSLWKDTRPAGDQAVEAGDVFVRVGRPGLAVMVLDVATDAEGHVQVLLGRGGTPAQTFHVLRRSAQSPWFALTQTEPIDLGEKAGVLRLKDLRHWGE